MLDIFSDLLDGALGYHPIIQIIIGLSALAILAELIITFWFCAIQVRSTGQVIRYLRRNGSSNKLILDSKSDSFRTWFNEHADGRFQNDSDNINIFIPKRDDQRISLKALPAIVRQPVSTNPFAFCATLLPALGVLGTFWGIYFGLQEINLSALTSTDTLLSSSTTLLEGMKIAFETSVFGIAGGLIVGGSTNIGRLAREQRRGRMRKGLRRVAFLPSPSQLLSKIDNREVAQAMTAAARSLESINTDRLGQIIGDSIKESMSPVVNDMNALRGSQEKQCLSMDNFTQELMNNVRIIQETQNAQSQSINNLILQMRSELIEPVVERLDESAHLIGETSTAVTDLKNSLGEITQRLGESVNTIQEFQQNTLRQLEAFAQNMQDILGQFRLDTQNVLRSVSDEIQRAVQESIRGLEAQRQAFEDSGQRAAQLMDNAGQQLLATLGNIDEMLQRTRVTVQEELERFRLEYQAALQEFFSEQNNLLNETLGQQREGLARVVADLRTTFADEAEKRRELSLEVEQNLKTIERRINAVSELAEAVGLNSSQRMAQLQELASTIGNEIGRIEAANKNLNTKFDEACQSLTDNLNSMLTSGNEALNEYLRSESEAHSSKLQEFDSSAARVCSSLDQTANGLYEAAGHLVAAAEDFKNGRGE